METSVVMEPLEFLEMPAMVGSLVKTASPAALETPESLPATTERLQVQMASEVGWCLLDAR